jgi:hypothetical protein
MEVLVLALVVAGLFFGFRDFRESGRIVFLRISSSP